MAEKDPVSRFLEWYDEAKRREPDVPNAMALATTDAGGAPSLRMVLLKDVDQRGFVFYTNLESRKGLELAIGGKAALLFHWKSLHRQVRVEGPAEPVTDAEADAYFATRDRGAQIGAWASEQSRVMEGRLDLEKRVAKFAAKFGFGTVPRPPFWSGYRIVPERIEFWSEGKFRLHEREAFTRNGEAWRMDRLYP